MQPSLNYGKRCLSDYIDGFLAHLENVKHLSSHTVFHYGHDLSLFLRYLSHRMDCTVLEVKLQDIKAEHIDGFLDYLITERANSPRSAKRRLSAIRSFYNYLWNEVPKVRKNIGNPADTVPIPRVSEPLPRTLSKGEVVTLLRASRSHSPFPHRDYVLLRLFINCGARLSEVTELKLDDFDEKDGWIRFGRDTNRDRRLPLSHETIHAMVTYLATRPVVPTDFIFINRLGNPITKGAVYHLLKRCLSAASLSDQGITIHSLRHTCFANLAREGFTPYDLKALSGLRRIQTTSIYKRIASDESNDTSDEEESSDTSIDEMDN